VGSEVDVVFETAQGLQPVEIKSGATFASDWIGPLRRWAALGGNDSLPPWIIYGGSKSYEREGCRVIGWRQLADA
jgi:hypothetical protein